MSTAPTRVQTLTPKDLRGWPDTVTTALLNLVTRRGVRAKVLDGNHVFLYAPDGEGTIKVSRSRKTEDTLKFLGKFCDEHLPPVVRDDRPAKADELAPLLKLNTKAQRQAAREAAEAEALAQAAEAHAQATWQPYMGYNGRTKTTFETNGNGVFRCTVEGCGEVMAPGKDARKVLGPHASSHRRRGRPLGKRVPVSPNVWEMRKATGLPWSNIGRAMGMTDSGVRAWVTRGAMPEAQAQPLANVLGVTVAQLTGAEPWTPRPGTIPGPRRAPEPEAAPETPQAPPVAELDPYPGGPVPTDVATGAGRSYLARIASLAHQALGEPDLAAELTTTTAELGRTKAELAQAKKELGEANAKLEILREALEVVDG